VNSRILILPFAAIAFLLSSADNARGEQVSFSIVASFNGTNGYAPTGVILGRDGCFYGATAAGGATWTNEFVPGYGTVFKITAEGEISTLASFFHTNGGSPRGEAMQASDGNIYGTTRFGGAASNNAFGSGYEAGYGSVYCVTTNGDFTMLVSFNGTNGAIPEAGLVEGPDGALYGTTRFGGASLGDPRTFVDYASVSGFGTVFRVTTNGDFKTLYSFTPDTAGRTPMCALMLARDGYLYGQTINAMVFKMTAAGVLTPWVFLNSTNWISHLTQLVQGRKGNLYGVSQGGGVYHHGAVFSLTSDGSQPTLHSFPSEGIAMPAVVEGTDGKWYGGRAAGHYGVLYAVSPEGIYSEPFTFGYTNGSGLSGALVQAKDGALYGAASGGSNGTGLIFRLNVPSAATPKLEPPAVSGNGVALSWSTIPSRTYQVQFTTGLVLQAWTNLGTSILVTNAIGLTSDSVVTEQQRFYRVVMLP
jgi:uncharacterized repeat protein (TIGR03803 family)